MTEKNPLVSIIVTTKNEESNIRYCLLSIKAQTYHNIEIIVVDNDSDDRTKEISCKFTKLVFNKGPERSAQRNYGMLEIARGDFLMFVDADMILSPSLIENCVKFINNDKCSALHIPEIILGKSYFCKIRRFERGFYNGTVIDGARFFRKDVFRKVHGFDENMSGPEDWDIDKKIKKHGKINMLRVKENHNLYKNWALQNLILKKGVNPCDFGDVIFHNESEVKLIEYLTKKAYYSGSFQAYIDKWGDGDADIKKQFGLSYRYLEVFIENGKWKRFVRKPHLIAGLYCLRILVGVSFLKRIVSDRNSKSL